MNKYCKLLEKELVESFDKKPKS